MVTADADVDVPDQLLALENRDAALQNARGAELVQLSVNHDKRLGSPSEAPRLGAVRGLDPSNHSVEVLDAPILRSGGLVNFHCLGLVRRGGLEVNVHGLDPVRRGTRGTRGLAPPDP